MTAPSRNGELIDAAPLELQGIESELERLREMVRARDDFIVTLTHELRNPVSAIHLQTEAVLLSARRAGNVPSGVMTRLESLKRQTDAFVKRATTLLDLSRLAAGKVTIDFAACDLGTIVGAVVDAFRAELELRQISLRLSLGNGLGAELDPVRVEQIVFNLVSNAIKYGDGSPIYVGVRARGGHAVLIVRDRGVGISATDQKRIFERFMRTRERTNEAGFGVGLWLVRALVHAMGGTIDVRSRVGKGSAFVVILPLRPRQTIQTGEVLSR